MHLVLKSNNKIQCSLGVYFQNNVKLNTFQNHNSLFCILNSAVTSYKLNNNIIHEKKNSWFKKKYSLEGFNFTYII